ncbi:hypothetical protein [Lysobacter gummosus]|uniref:hypothetical protein n=1 Tax=Lysobacter gummosus TaxID=262324 RepID=UPI003637F3F3
MGVAVLAAAHVRSELRPAVLIAIRPASLAPRARRPCCTHLDPPLPWVALRKRMRRHGRSRTLPARTFWSLV